MKVQGKRSRQIAFRLSEDEYEALSAACTETGSRSISDLVRAAAESAASDGSIALFGIWIHRVPVSLGDRVARVAQVLELLTREVNEIKGRLEASTNRS